MSDEIPVGDLTFVSSKRASEISGYAQDYIGQLARKGLIDAKRVGGLWYVHMESLESYKAQPDPLTILPRQEREVQSDLDVLVSFDGKDYISANRASKLTGYNQDYVGQLARSGKILARQVGNRWYVDHAGILAHKKEKDELLASVQAAAVGIYPIENTLPVEAPSEQIIEAPLLNYIADVGELAPTIKKNEREEAPFSDSYVTRPEHVTDLKARNKEVPIRVNKTNYSAEDQIEPIRLQYTKHANPSTKRAIRPMWTRPRIIVTIGAAILCLTIATYVYSAHIAGGELISKNVKIQMTSVVIASGNFMLNIANGIEHVISPDLVYQRKS
jgi:hypothetical protein